MNNKYLNKFISVTKNQKKADGFTLLELIVAAFISTIIINIAGFGIVTIVEFNKKAEARTERRIDLSRAFDFMTNEIRMARRINSTATKTADGITITVKDVVIDSGLNLSDLGNYGEIVLYLEVPMTPTNTICPPGSSNAGSLPPAPANYDRVVYDIRGNTNGWLGPRVITRYGRIPRSDGTVDPCKNPVASDTLVDSISDTNISSLPTCNAVLSGSGGFYACVNGSQVDLYLSSKVIDTETQDIASRAGSRVISGSSISAPDLEGTRSLTDMNLSWKWTGTGSVTFTLYQSVNGLVEEAYSGPAFNAPPIPLKGNSGDVNCFVVTATVDSNTSTDSNQMCEFK